jgi:HAD superfamily hydrolase (TIGR01509 family)
MSGPPAAVVFDCDGVLVDSEALSWSIWTEVLAGHGYAVTDEDEAIALGRRLPELHAHFAERVALPPLEEFTAAITAATLERFAASLRPFPDAVALLDALAAAGVPLGVASSSLAPRLRQALEVTGVGVGRFGAVVSGDEVEHGKPAPDTYALAASRLGVAPEACWAIEDSPLGLASARAAGLRVIAVVRGHVPRAQLADADLVVDRLDEPGVRTTLLGR